MKRHPFDVLSFVAGTVFVILGAAFATAGSDVVDQARWVWPAILLTLGAAGVAAVLRQTSNDESENESVL